MGASQVNSLYFIYIYTIYIYIYDIYNFPCGHLSLPNLSPDMTLKVNGTDWKKYGQIGKRGIFHDGIHEIWPQVLATNQWIDKTGEEQPGCCGCFGWCRETFYFCRAKSQRRTRASPSNPSFSAWYSWYSHVWIESIIQLSRAAKTLCREALLF